MYIYLCIHPYIIVHECVCIPADNEVFKCKNGYLILIFAIASATVTFWYVVYECIYLRCIHPYIIIYECVCIRVCNYVVYVYMY
jgi:hypothetical protein